MYNAFDRDFANAGSASFKTLNAQELYRAAPSVFASEASSRMSDRYLFVPTIEAVEALAREGFLPVKASEARTRIDANKGYTRHVIRFRHVDVKPEVGGVLPEVVLMNSHNGSSCYQLSAGLFRLVCANGLVVADSMIDTVRCRHSAGAIDDVIEGTYRILSDVPKAFEQVEQFSRIELTQPQQVAFARAAIQLKWPLEEDGTSQAPIEATDVLRSRRFADNSNDLFTTFNRVQENMIKGGVPGRTRTNRRTSTRAVTAPGENVKLNKALWSLQEEMARLIAG